MIRELDLIAWNGCLRELCADPRAGLEMRCNVVRVEITSLAVTAVQPFPAPAAQTMTALGYPLRWIESSLRCPVVDNANV